MFWRLGWGADVYGGQEPSTAACKTFHIIQLALLMLNSEVTIALAFIKEKTVGFEVGDQVYGNGMGGGASHMSWSWHC